jgi:hypothetical protein
MSAATSVQSFFVFPGNAMTIKRGAVRAVISQNLRRQRADRHLRYVDGGYALNGPARHYAPTVTTSNAGADLAVSTLSIIRLQ